MKFEEAKLKGLFSITPEIFNDSRGFLMEVYQKELFQKQGIAVDFLQVNHSSSKKGVVRGLHFQWDKPLGKLMRVIRGKAFVAAADIRKKSPTFGQWTGEELSE
ncbi:MAG: dTDP-4-dehydrorhamnose 3,5-epimerase family protein, partial [Candidatus Sungbacteria bacterium]|nr:dTDP-4-dehydrorhamnose 3,5-epimerase family protein [Candidatus Sungbacteria bacterium]